MIIFDAKWGNVKSLKLRLSFPHKNQILCAF
nr:MAG TPA: hypothetical protein [Caudoviricetes sp.]